MPLPEFNQICQEAKRDIQEIDVVELERMRAQKEDFELIDVREKDEVEKEMIPDARHLSRGILERDIDQITIDKNRTLVLYCGGGNRSALAAVNLKKMGFKKVISLAGGWASWKSSQH